MALTLIEAAKLQSGDVIRSSVIEKFARESDVLRVMPFLDIPGNAYKYNVESGLPGVAFRGVNEAYAESTGVLNPVTESLAIAGGDLDVDKFIVSTQGSVQRSTHELLKVKKLAQTFTQKFVKGDSSSDPKEFDGLQRRLTGSQLIEAGSTDGGDALSLAKLDELIDAVDVSDGSSFLLMSKAMRRRLTIAARTTTVGGYITYDQDEFGRQVTRYNDLPILIADRSDQETAALAFDEVGVGGSTATATSIYCLSFGGAQFTGLQNGVMDVRDLGEQDAKPVFRTRVEWYVSMALLNSRAAARLRGIADAAIVA